MQYAFISSVIKALHRKKTNPFEFLLFPNKLEFITYKFNPLVDRKSANGKGKLKGKSFKARRRTQNETKDATKKQKRRQHQQRRGNMGRVLRETWPYEASPS